MKREERRKREWAEERRGKGNACGEGKKGGEEDLNPSGGKERSVGKGMKKKDLINEGGKDNGKERKGKKKDERKSD